MISQTSGHGISGCAAICRAPTTPLSLVENTGVAMIADGEARCCAACANN